MLSAARMGRAGCVVVALAILLGGCADPKRYDPVAKGILPEHAQLVAYTHDAYKPLLFTVPADGQVIYVGSGHVLATLAVAAGDVVTLNEWDGFQLLNRPLTRVTVNDKMAYSIDRTRHCDSRFYFIAANESPPCAASEEPSPPATSPATADPQ